MTPEIKQRIEQIRQSEVPEGYQKTNVGIIPSEWKIRALSQLMHFKNGINADKSKFGKGTRLISVCDLLKDSPIYYDTIIGMVDISDAQQKEFSVTYGDILFQRSSENYEDAGTSNVYLDHTSTATFSGFIIRGKKIADYNPVYLNALLRTSKIRKSIVRLAAGAQHINIGQDSLASVKVPFANDLEQQKIATILSTQDKVIELKGKRLTERQRQKKYLMQQLLTGKRRLPGFSGEWSMQPLSQLSKVITKKTADEEYEVLSISAGIGFVNQSEKFGKQIAGEQYKNYTVISRGDFSYNKGNSKKYPQGCIYPLESRECAAVPNVFISFTMQKSKCFWKYYKYLFENGWLNKQLYRLINSGVRNDGLLNLSDKEFFNCVVPVPPFNEQTAIAEILSTSDREIDLLQQDIEQEKKKKKALMQLLLTGIVRVKT